MKAGAASQQDYSVREVAELVSLPVAEIRRCLREGLLATRWLPGTRARLGFQDLVLLRSVASLRSARVPPHRVRRALRKLREQLPEDLPLSSVQVEAGGSQVVAREGSQIWDAESQQLLLGLGVKAPTAEAPVPVPLLPLPLLSAEARYQEGCLLEETDPVAARRAYEDTVRKDPSHVDARLNLGRLLHGAGLLQEAEACFRKALELRPDDPTLSFNLGVALEDQAKEDAAMAAYARAIFLEPGFADAHFNLARLHELRGDRLAALRHLKAYRATIEA
jgi:tetratricopeptide (TPR) repeat protein